MPDAAWTAAVDLIALEDPAGSETEWAGLGRVAYIGPEGCFTAVDPSAMNPPELLGLLHHERAVKTPYELECLRQANRIGTRGHRAALEAFRAGASEYGAHMRYLEACPHREEDLPYNNIVAYNENAAVLHYQRLEFEPPRPLRSFLLDAGAQFRGYAADITRTHAAGPGAFADLIAAVDEAQLLLCAEIVAGRDYRDVHLTAHRLLGDVLHRAGVTKLPGQEALEAGLTAVFFPHGIGHLLGLQVHDVGGVLAPRPQGHPYLRLTRMLEPGVVVTVEPGLYFIDSLLKKAYADGRRAHIDWPTVEALRPYGGIRIEDNVAATATEPENLTRNAFARNTGTGAG
jgi:Xaa-Pro dipeptidase